MDTGADESLITGTDAARIRIDVKTASASSIAQGIGGSIRTYVEPAVIVFSEPGVGLWAYREDLEILEPDADDAAEVMAGIDDPEASQKLPSLLGREILDRWKVIYHRAEDTLTFEVISADDFISLPPLGR